MTAPDHSAADAALAAYEAAVATATATAAQAYQSALATAQQALTAETAKDTADEATVTSLTAEVAQLQQQLAALQPAPPTFTTGIDINLVGVTNSTLAGQEGQAVAKFGTANRGAKFFDGGAGPQAAVSNMVASGWGKAPGETEPIICFKRLNSADVTYLTAYLKTVTAETFLCFWQEPEDDFAKGNVTVAAWQAAYKQLDALRKAAPNPSLIKLAVCLMAYQENQVASSTKWQAFLPPLKGIIDLVGIDDYDPAFDAATWTPDQYMSVGPAAAASVGTPWAVTEFGVEVSTKTAGDTPAAAVARVMASAQYAKANGALWLNYWYAGAWVQVTGLDAALKSLAA